MLHYKDAIPNISALNTLVNKVLHTPSQSSISGLIEAYCKEAICEAQLAYGVALVTAEVLWTDDEVSGSETRLPVPAKVILGVKVDGQDSPYELIGDTIVKLGREGRTCEVSYRCGAPVTHDVDYLVPQMAEYVRARVEGQTKQEARRYFL